MDQDIQHSSRALIIDDHPIVVDALGTALLSLHVFDGIDKESSIAGAAERLQNADNYDLVLLDLHLADAVGLDAMLLLRERFPEVPVIIFSGDDSSTTVAAAFEHGVQGYVPKNSPMTEVIGAIRAVLRGGNYIPPQAVRMLGFAERSAAPLDALTTASEGLTPRQRQVLHYLLQGLPNKVIGTRLQMADGTVKSHASVVYRVFRVNSRAQLILRARELGLI